MNCATGRRGCSFKDYDFGIAKPPMLRRTEAGNLRRAEQVQSKQKGGSKRTTAEGDISLLEVPGQSVSTMTKGKGRALPVPEIRKAASDGTPVPSAILSQVPEFDNSTPIMTQDLDLTKARSVQGPSYVRMSGRDERLFFEDILRFERLATSSSCSVGELSLARVELNSIAIRERMQANALEAFTLDRCGVMGDIVAQLGERIKSMGGKLRDLQPIPAPVGLETDTSDEDNNSAVEKGKEATDDRDKGTGDVPME